MTGHVIGHGVGHMMGHVMGYVPQERKRKRWAQNVTSRWHTLVVSADGTWAIHISSTGKFRCSQRRGLVMRVKVLIERG